MADLFTLQTKIIEQKTKVDLNSELAKKIIKQEVDECCKDLDGLCSGIKEIIFKDSEDLTLPEYENIAMKLSLILYDMETITEYSNVKLSISQFLQEDKYSYLFLNSKGSGSISDREMICNAEIQPEVVASILAKHTLKILDSKKKSAYELLGVVKKIITLRISSNDYNNL